MISITTEKGTDQGLLLTEDKKTERFKRKLLTRSVL